MNKYCDNIDKIFEYFSSFFENAVSILQSMSLHGNF